MTRFEWACLLGVLVGFAILLWVCQGWPQDVDPLEARLESIEQRLDQLLRQEEATPARPKPRPKPRLPRRREPSIFDPAPLARADLPRLEAMEAPEEPPARVCCHRTWEDLDAERQERDLVDGD
jgi:hypothetical protein